jgi:hypothetical protein
MQAVVAEAPESLIGRMVECRIIGIGAHSLHGEIAVLDGDGETPAERVCA